MASRQQISMFMSEFEQLHSDCDVAAYRAVGSIQAALDFIAKNQTPLAIEVLTAALDRYQHADSQLQKFNKKGETYGNRSNQSAA